MANAAKSKGDRFEREAVDVLVELFAAEMVDEYARRAPEWKPMRMLGAGRLEDIGDLDVLSDVCFQVKAYAQVNTAVREAAAGAAKQSRRAGTRFECGLVPVTGRQKAGVRWLASSHEWPSPVIPKRFSNPVDAVTWMRAPETGVAVEDRVCLVERAGTIPVWIAPLQAWAAAYRIARNGEQRAAVDVRELRPAAAPSPGRKPPANVEGQLQLIA